MSVNVQTRNPQFRVRIITRNHGEITDAEIRPSFRQFEVTRRMGEPGGSFQLTLLPRRPPQRLLNAGKSWQDVIEPMDYVEISAWVPPRRDEVPIFRGFVDSVGESFSIGGGQPQGHVISVVGRDYGKITLVTKLYYVGEKLPETLAIFQKWKDGFDKLFKPEDPDPEAAAWSAAEGAGASQKSPFFVTPQKVIQVVFDQFYRPQEQAIRKTFPAPFPEASLRFAIDPEHEDKLRAYNPTFTPQSWTPFSDVWSLFRAYMHEPWRELFFEEAQTGPSLIYRETPWIDLNGQSVQVFDPETAKIVPISLSDRIEWSLFRSDEKVLNFFFTYPSQFGAIAALAKTLGTSLEGVYAQPMFQSNPHLVGMDTRQINEAALATGEGEADTGNLQESAYQRHGVRLREVYTPYLNVDRRLDDASMEVAIKSIREQGVEANQRLVKAMDHGALLEFGAITLKGDERLRIGRYAQFTENGALYYITGVTHRFTQGSNPADGQFVTALTVERGRGHIVRTRGMVRGTVQ